MFMSFPGELAGFLFIVSAAAISRDHVLHNPHHQHFQGLPGSRRAMSVDWSPFGSTVRPPSLSSSVEYATANICVLVAPPLSRDDE